MFIEGQMLIFICTIGLKEVKVEEMIIDRNIENKANATHVSG
jgi:hypothetical protein